MQRFIVTRQVPKLVPRRNFNPQTIARDGNWVFDVNGSIVYDTILIPVGHYIGPNACPKQRPSHPGKPPEYYRKRTIPKHLRTK